MIWQYILSFAWSHFKTQMKIDQNVLFIDGSVDILKYSSIAKKALHSKKDTVLTALSRKTFSW